MLPAEPVRPNKRSGSSLEWQGFSDLDKLGANEYISLGRIDWYKPDIGLRQRRVDDWYKQTIHGFIYFELNSYGIRTWMPWKTISEICNREGLLKFSNSLASVLYYEYLLVCQPQTHNIKFAVATEGACFSTWNSTNFIPTTPDFYLSFTSNMQTNVSFQPVNTLQNKQVQKSSIALPINQNKL